MPLSEEELRLLEQMERALVEEDPKLASTLRGTSLRRSARRRAILAGLVFAIGIAVLMTGAITQLWPVGIVGFVIMLGSATVALGSIRGQQRRRRRARRPTDHSSGFTRHRGRPCRPHPPAPQPHHLLRLLHGADGGALASPPRRERRLLSSARRAVELAAPVASRPASRGQPDVLARTAGSMCSTTPPNRPARAPDPGSRPRPAQHRPRPPLPPAGGPRRDARLERLDAEQYVVAQRARLVGCRAGSSAAARASRTIRSSACTASGCDRGAVRRPLRRSARRRARRSARPASRRVSRGDRAVGPGEPQVDRGRPQLLPASSGPPASRRSRRAAAHGRGRRTPATTDQQRAARARHRRGSHGNAGLVVAAPVARRRSSGAAARRRDAAGRSVWVCSALAAMLDGLGVGLPTSTCSSV